MKIGVIIVSYNTRGLLARALTSIAESARASSLPHEDVSVVVVDNGSSDGSAQMVARDFPSVRLLPLQDNVGFTRANNIALAAFGFPASPNTVNFTNTLCSGSPRAGTPFRDNRESRLTSTPDYVLLLNSDAEITGDALGRMIGFMDAQPAAGACGPRLQYADGSFQHGAFHFPSIGQVALDLYPVDRLPGAGRLYNGAANGRYPSRCWTGVNPFRVDFVLGAAMMMRREALLTIGVLDEEFFMYCEEMDWCLRLRQAGLDVYAVPTARFVHHEGQSSRQAPWPAFCNLWRSRIRFYRKHADDFPRGQLYAVRILLRTAMRLRAHNARSSFARGASSGTELHDALSAYAYVGSL